MYTNAATRPNQVNSHLVRKKSDVYFYPTDITDDKLTFIQCKMKAKKGEQKQIVELAIQFELKKQ